MLLYIWKKGDKMIDVNVGNLKENIDKLQSIIDKYENTQLNIFNQLKESTVNWQDGNSIKFENSIYLEKKESNLFLQSLQNKKDIYDYICKKYGEIGNKIECYLNNKSSLLNAIDICYNETVNILNEFDKINTDFYYKEQDAIFLQKQKIKEVREELKTVKSLTSQLFIKIENIEKNIKEKIVTLNEIKINAFDFYEE